MKAYILLILVLVSNLILTAQTPRWDLAKNWRIYSLVDGEAIDIRVDSLQKKEGKALVNDNIKFYLSDAKPIPRKDNPLWMGAYLMSYTDSAGVFRKFLVSTYGGFVFDDGTKTHYLLQEYKWEGWKEFVESSYDQSH